ncbi:MULTISPECIES: HAD-IIIC family phosphatase [unclassified Streptomyces]|uniref:HAD-IIIC family phosphatase n=1 Tax=unclassified Streptomyces TaxID=2593676 RepID=UPI000371420C|nr:MULTISPECIES: HAD-IIIC family phosphatase [unclassified Streptomyces]MYT33694.1 HAD-IIIC family phosphatase [Streptomyces sp. SID8354]
MGGASRRDEIHAALRAVLDPADRLVVVHSSLFAFRTPTDGLRGDLLAALRALVADGITVALPAVTFEFCRTKEYHHRRSVPNTGVLVEWFLDLPEVRRTPHPVYSFAVAGPLADELTACRSDTAFGADTVFEVFERRGARIVTLGAGWNSCTQVHRYEELAQVPYRHPMTVSGTADFGTGPVRLDLEMIVRDTALKSTLDFAPVFDRLRESGAMARAELWGTTLESVATTELARVCGELMADDPYVLLREPRVIEHRARQLAAEPVRLAVLGSRNLEILAGEMAAEGSRVLGFAPHTLYVPEYGTLAREIHDPDSTLRGFGPQASFFVDRLEDVLGVEELDDADGERLGGALEHYTGLVSAYAETTDRPVFVLSFAPLQPYAAGVGALLREADRLLREALSAHDHVHVIELPEIIARVDGGPLVDPRLWLVGRVPHGVALSKALARRFWGLTLSVTGRTARVIVTDLDNTLWHGVVGEDGIEGIQVGTDHPGNAHHRLQRALKSLRERGIALAVCSKNDEDLALRAIREHSGMVLREDDFVATEISWRPKAEAIADIAERLNVGLSNVLFLDDNPVERTRVREFLPQVIVPELPEDPAGYADVLLDSPFTTVFNVTEADRRRTEQYRAREQVERRRRGFERIEDFYASLETELHLSPLTEGNTARAEQLCAKTNQFNTTTRRHTRAELRRLAAAPESDVLVLGVADRFSAREDLGLLVLSHQGTETTVDAYLLSCRVLGRGVEAGVLRVLAAGLAADGRTRLHGLVVPTERNAPCRTVFADAGFSPGAAEGTWHLDLTGDHTAPSWLRIHDHTEPENHHA